MTKVDLLIVNRNNLPWLKLLFSQASVMRSDGDVETIPHVWDNASTDGSKEWIAKNVGSAYLSPVAGGHAPGLVGLMKITDSPIVAYMDVDAFPVAKGWLEEAVSEVGNGAALAGLESKLPGDKHASFVHPSFCVFRRDLFNKLKLDPAIVHDYENHVAYDVGEVMSRRVVAEGLRLAFLGKAMAPPSELRVSRNRVAHAWTSWHMMVDANFPKEAVKQCASGHRGLLQYFNLWDRFLGYVRESADRNPLLERYLQLQ